MAKRFGRLAKKPEAKTLKLSKYLLAGLPVPPAQVDNLSKVYEKLGIDKVQDLFPMDGNDTLGDCTIAAAGHAITLWNGLNGVKNVPEQGDLVGVYKSLTGGQDSGLVETDVLKFWMQTGICGDKILAYIEVDHKNRTHVEQAIQLFGGLYIGVNVTAQMEKQFDHGRPWTPGHLTGDGHAMFAASYDHIGVTCLTWGNRNVGTWSWWMEAVDEAYAILPSEAAAFDGLDLETLKVDLQLI